MHAPIIYDLSAIAPDTRELILATPKYRQLFTVLPDQMLRLDGSTKVIKGNRLGFRTAILYLAPHTLSGKNLCPMAAIAKCAVPCLNKAGRGIMPSNQISRLRKALFLAQYPEQALALIKHEIALYQARGHREGWTLLVRLNGTSDIRWENYDVIQSFPDVMFYDYTKLANRHGIPSNYDLTFSYSGVPAYLPYVKTAMANGMRIAVVFRNRAMVDEMLARNEPFMGMPVVDGDDTDIRHLDPRGVAVALYAKGTNAKNDNSGFIVEKAA